MSVKAANCGTVPQTWAPMRRTDLHYLEDEWAALRVWMDRRGELRQMLKRRYGHLVAADLLEMIMFDCEFATTTRDRLFFDECLRDGVTVEGIES